MSNFSLAFDQGGHLKLLMAQQLSCYSFLNISFLHVLYYTVEILIV